MKGVLAFKVSGPQGSTVGQQYGHYFCLAFLCRHMQGRLLALAQRSEQGGPILYQRRRYIRMGRYLQLDEGPSSHPGL